VRAVDDFRSKGAIGTRRGGENDASTARDHGGDPQHEGCGGQDCGASGDVEADAFNGPHETRADHAWHGLDFERLLLLLRSMEFADILEADVDRFDGLRWELH